MSASYHSKSFRFGYAVEPEQWAEISKQFAPLLRQISEVATYIAEGTSASGRVEMLRQLDVALRWFYEACRANEDLISVTHFASCLDTLAGGKGDDSILRLLETVCGMKREAPIHIDGHTLSTIIRKMYGDARSQFLHGSTTGHLEDWSDLKMSAETVTRWVLVLCLFKAEENPTLVTFI